MGRVLGRSIGLARVVLQWPFVMAGRVRATHGFGKARLGAERPGKAALGVVLGWGEPPELTRIVC